MAVCKLVEYLTLAVFAVLVPRLMGPALYGQFALLMAFIILVGMLSGLGALSTFGRFVPAFQVQDQVDSIRVLFTQILLVRILIVAAVSLPFLIAFRRLLPDLPPATAWIGMAAMSLFAVGMTFYDLMHGLNALGKWLLRSSLDKGVLLLALILLGGIEIMERAAIALLVTQAFFFGVGLYWTRDYLAWGRPILNVAFLYTHLRFGVLLFLGGLLLMAIVRLGEIVVASYTDDPGEVAFFNLAGVVMMTMFALIGQLSRTILPTLSTYRASGNDLEVFEWLGISLKYLTILAVTFFFVIFAAARELVATVWGADFIPVAGNLVVLSVGLLVTPVIALATSLAILYNRPERLVLVSAGALFVFLAGSAILVPGQASLGASVSVTLGLWCAAFLALFVFRRSGVREVLAASRFGPHAICGGGAFASFALPLGTSVALGVAIAGYLALLWIAEVLQASDVRRLIRLLTDR